MIAPKFLTKVMFAGLVLIMIQTGCSKEALGDLGQPNDEEIALRSSDFNFTTSLKGRNEVPPVDTRGAGQVSVRISDDETAVYYKITASNLDNVRASHFHLGAEGVNGPVVAFLYSNANQPSGPQNGVLAEGVITAANMIGPLAGNLAGLIANIRAGKIYVNVHTLTNPGGEIRGQL